MPDKCIKFPKLKCKQTKELEPLEEQTLAAGGGGVGVGTIAPIRARAHLSSTAIIEKQMSCFTSLKLEV